MSNYANLSVIEDLLVKVSSTNIISTLVMKSAASTQKTWKKEHGRMMVIMQELSVHA